MKRRRRKAREGGSEEEEKDVCVCVCVYLVSTHGHSDVLLGDLEVSNVFDVVSCQFQDVCRDVLQHSNHVH